MKSIEPKSAASRDGRIAVGDQLVMVGKGCYSPVFRKAVIYVYECVCVCVCVCVGGCILFSQLF